MRKENRRLKSAPELMANTPWETKIIPQNGAQASLRFRAGPVKVLICTHSKYFQKLI